VIRVVGKRRLDVDNRQELAVAVRDLPAPREDPVELLELADAERRREIVEAVVEPQAAVLEPARRLEPPLVAQ
jgi:hypothetical protein